MMPAEPYDLTATKVSLILGVSAYTVTRWADAKLLSCMKTAGGHRRFRLSDVERFRDERVEAAS